MPYGKDRARRRREGRVLKDARRQSGGQARILHADFNCERLDFLRGHFKDSRYGKPKEITKKIVQNNNDKNDGGRSPHGLRVA